MMTQYTNCGMNNYLVKLDGTMSNLPEFFGTVGNLGTQIATGWSKENTPVFISWKTIKSAWNKSDYAGIGKAF